MVKASIFLAQRIENIYLIFLKAKFNEDGIRIEWIFGESRIMTTVMKPHYVISNFFWT